MLFLPTAREPRRTRFAMRTPRRLVDRRAFIPNYGFGLWTTISTRQPPRSARHRRSVGRKTSSTVNTPHWQDIRETRNPWYVSTNVRVLTVSAISNGMAQNGGLGSEISPSVGTSKPSAEKATASSDGNTGDRVYIGRTPPSLRTLRRNRARPRSVNTAAGVLSGNKPLSRLEVNDASPLENPATPCRQSTARDGPSTRYRETPHPGPQSRSWSSSRQSPAATQSADYAGVLMAQDVPISSLGLRPHLLPALIRPRVSKGWRRCLADFVEHILLGFATAYVFVVCSFFGRMYGIW